ncbi:FMRFamide-related peptides [Gryllus bimaculatus]|nr:FMRFamide-related peptides [Gryllus bimaculatus]
MSLRKGAPPPPWRLLPVALLAAACALAAAASDGAGAAPDAAPSASPGQLPPSPGLGDREDDDAAGDADAALDELLLPRQGRAARDNFLRFGKAARDNFLRFGRAPRDNFLRFGKASRDNFLRFGRAPRDNFVRAASNFFRLGRPDPDAQVSLEEEALAARLAREDGEADSEAEAEADGLGAEEEPSLERLLRFARDRNFLRFGRGRPDNFVRFGRGGDDGSGDDDNDDRDGSQAPTHLGQEEAAAAAAASAAAVAAAAEAESEASTEGARAAEEGAEAADEHLQRVGRAARTRNLFGRWKMADLNFIRLGRSASAGAAGPAGALLPAPAKRSGTPPRPGRSQVGRTAGHVDNFLRLGNGKRAKRSAGASARPACAPRRPASLLGDLPLAPLTYYSPLAVGLPNYLLAPELGLLPAAAAAAPAKRGPADRQGSNFIRLG